MSPLLVEPAPRIEESLEHEVAIDVGQGLVLYGDLTLPTDSRGVIVVPHASRIHRGLPYNRAAARAMNRRALGTLLVDCLTLDEKGSVTPPVDAEMLAARLAVVTAQVRVQRETASLPLGYLATGDTAAVALLAAAQLRGSVGAIVLLGGPDGEAIASLDEAPAPCLMIGNGTVTDHARAARMRRQLGDAFEFAVVPGCHTLGRGDPGPHRRAFNRAAGWFASHLTARPSPVDDERAALHRTPPVAGGEIAIRPPSR